MSVTTRRRFIGSADLLTAADVARAAEAGRLAPPDKQPAGLKVGGPPGKKSGWAIVGLGQLALEEIMPAFAGCKRSEPVALVSGHRDKALEVARAHGIAEDAIYDYGNFDRIADDPRIDVVYIVLPNSLRNSPSPADLHSGPASRKIAVRCGNAWCPWFGRAADTAGFPGVVCVMVSQSPWPGPQNPRPATGLSTRFRSSSDDRLREAGAGGTSWIMTIQKSDTPQDSAVSPIHDCWSQMPQDDCRQFNGKPIEFFISVGGHYIEGNGTLDTFRHPTQPGLCRLGIVVPVPGSTTPCELFLPPAAVATITETRWDVDRFVLRMEEERA